MIVRRLFGHARVRVIVASLGTLLASTSAAAQASATQVLTLQDAIGIARRQSLPAQAASAARAAARGRDRAFGSRFFPRLGLTGNVPEYSRAIIPVIQPDGTTLYIARTQMVSTLNVAMAQELPFTGGELQLVSQLARTDIYADEDSRVWQSSPFAVRLTQPILRPNQFRWDWRVQDLQSTIAERQFVESGEDVALTTVDAFFDYFAAEINLANAQSNAAVNDTLFTLSKGRFEVGRIGENDLLQSELALLRAQTALDGARLEYERTGAALRLALNLPPNARLSVTPPVGVPLAEADSARAVTEALRNRSQMTGVELQNVQASREVAVARLENGIGANLTAEMGFNQRAPEFDGLYRELQERREFRLGVQVPLVQWGRRSGQIDAARAEQARAQSLGRQTMLTAAHEARFAALQLGQSARQLTISAKADTVAAKRFEVAKNRYIIGRIAIDNLYIAQNEKDQALRAYVDALRGYWTSFYRLRRLTLYDFVENRVIR
jgi:outer membrane protein TolC